ncbi:MAG: hypothetical protein AAB426_01995, partial [Myxococcota bacterium]
MTLPLQLGLSVVAGASMAVAARHEPMDLPIIRSFGLWALVLMQLVVVTPMTAYLLMTYPGWTLMYVLDPAVLPMPTPYLAAMLPVVAVVAFAGTLRALRRGRRLVTAVILLAGVLATAAIGTLGR